MIEIVCALAFIMLIFLFAFVIIIANLLEKIDSTLNDIKMAIRENRYVTPELMNTNKLAEAKGRYEAWIEFSTLFLILGK